MRGRRVSLNNIKFKLSSFESVVTGLLKRSFNYNINIIDKKNWFLQFQNFPRYYHGLLNL